jgi:nicotinamide-nucleotide amidase
MTSKAVPEAFMLVVGDELLDGSRNDLHTQWIAKQLKALGLIIREGVLVRDTSHAIHEGLNKLLSGKANAGEKIIFTSGGLGPTSDDITVASLASYFGWILERDDDSWRKLNHLLTSRGIPVYEGHERQCMMPVGALILTNDAGTAPGFIQEIPEKKVTVVTLPGPPHELRAMFSARVEPWLRQNFELPPIEDRLFQVFHTPESSIAGMIEAEDAAICKLQEQGLPVRISYREKLPRVFVKVEWRSQEARSKVAPLVQKIEQKFAGLPLWNSTEEHMQNWIIPEAARLGVTIACAESCTGGLLSERLTSVPGSSRVIWSNVVTYANEAKQQLLGVKPETLARVGAVSGAVASEMAEGVCRLAHATLGIGVTGIAGPTGGSADKPVGTVFIAICDSRSKNTRVYQHRFRGDRERVRQVATEAALWLLVQQISGYFYNVPAPVNP